MRHLTLICSIFAAIFSINAFAANFSIKTNSFTDGGLIPILYTCDGKDISPEISWANIPAKTQSFVLIVSDPDAPTGTFYHWLVFNIPKSARSLPSNSEPLPTGAMLGNNSWGSPMYKGPCPPKGAAHTYIFTLYALDTKLKLSAGTDFETLNEAIKNHILETTKITASYNH